MEGRMQKKFSTAKENKAQGIFRVENIPIWLERSDEGDIWDGDLRKNWNFFLQVMKKIF